ncbi:hypothetical protein EYF80_067108 [Liparis tanakae]|uniref:Uncharacterized protein n=1 Tax=Liparis tanakae TaxID=230148 RepID=A0A4Z2E1X6_9TELE|nr:hypothetical protein EYF80_067108 [Liparis tanakae]
MLGPARCLRLGNRKYFRLGNRKYFRLGNRKYFRLGNRKNFRLGNRKYFNLLSGSDDQRHIVQSTSQVTLYCLRYATRTDRVTCRG